MTFLSYAQNAEDVLLWRALGHIKNGFYIDVGANDPVDHSVTKAFYDAGWYGINIEPLPAFHQAFLEQRPRDINLAVAAGARDGSITLFDVPAVNGWASSDPTVAAAHRADGYAVTELTVPVRTLAGICAEHAGGAIHFLKIDVEGFEGEVLRGMDLVTWRPWILVIEATLPNSRVTNHQAWETLVTGSGYRYAWFDGLNRYYVADEHADLADALTIQPNVFDDFISHHLDSAWRSLKKAGAASAEAHTRAAAAEQKQWHADQRTDAAIAAASQAAELSRQTLAMLDQANAHTQHEQTEKLAAQRHAGELAAALGAQQDRVGALEQQLADLADLAQARFDALEADNSRADALEQQLANLADLVQARFDALQAAKAQAALDRKAVDSAQARAHALTQELNTTLVASHHLSEWARGLEHALLAMRASSSWRITAPWRSAGGWLKGWRSAGPLRRVVTRITANERARRLLIPLLLRYPALGQRVTRTVSTIKQAPMPAAAPDVAVPEELKALPASARKVLGDLQRALRPDLDH